MNKSNSHTSGYSGADTIASVAVSPGSFIASIPERAFRVLTVWQKRHEDRLHLQSMSDHLIKDTGMTRNDIRIEVSKAFWEE